MVQRVGGISMSKSARFGVEFWAPTASGSTIQSHVDPSIHFGPRLWERPGNCFLDINDIKNKKRLKNVKILTYATSFEALDLQPGTFHTVTYLPV